MSKLVDMNGILDKMNWMAIAREVTLRNSKGKSPKNGGQVCGRMYYYLTVSKNKSCDNSSALIEYCYK